MLCAAGVVLPWLSVEGGAGSEAARRGVDLLALNPTSAGVILGCLGGCVGVSFAASRRRVFRTILVFLVLGTCVAVLVPFALYSAPGGGAAYSALRRMMGTAPAGRIAMAWGAWVSLGLCALAWAGAMVYLFLPAPDRPPAGALPEPIYEKTS